VSVNGSFHPMLSSIGVITYLATCFYICKYRGVKVRIISSFFPEAMETRRKQSAKFKLLREKNTLQLRIFCAANFLNKNSENLRPAALPSKKC
jgi:hypothetical protein